MPYSRWSHYAVSQWQLIISFVDRFAFFNFFWRTDKVRVLTVYWFDLATVEVFEFATKQVMAILKVLVLVVVTFVLSPHGRLAGDLNIRSFLCIEVLLSLSRCYGQSAHLSAIFLLLLYRKH